MALTMTNDIEYDNNVHRTAIFVRKGFPERRTNEQQTLTYEYISDCLLHEYCVGQCVVEFITR